MKACFRIAECSLSSAKIAQTRAMKACFRIAECSLSSAKVVKISLNRIFAAQLI
ncbi:hypothetical protein HMPREF1146_1112 [Prevotella sp. MSX73]|nr:hypothetical protein HMPREF1146_1112 [Prevotella sp. MSX73]